MASRIAGITVEIGGNTTKLEQALKGVNKQISSTQTALRDVEKLLKLDPTSTELLSQKQKLLKDAISETKDRLASLQDAAANSDLGADEHDALQREIIDTQQKLKSLEDQYKDFGSVAQQQIQAVGEQMQEIGGKIQDVGSKILSVGAGLTKSVTAPIAAVGAASVAAWNEVDAAMDTIVTKTGATGDALDDMQSRAKSIAQTIPTSFQTAADAVGEVNTRFGLTGDALEDLSTRFVKFADLNNTDVSSSVDLVQSSLTAFDLEADSAGSVLDTLNKVGQDTGESVDSLADSLIKNAATLKELNLDFDDSAVLLGNLSKNGVDASAAMTGLKKAYAESIKTGKPLGVMLSDLEARLQNNDTHAQAAAEAIDLFGSKAGGHLVDALTNGRLSFDDLNVSIDTFAGSVSNTFEETLDPLDKFQTILNTVKGNGADIVETAGPMIETALQSISDVVHSLSDAWNGLNEDQQQMIVKVGLVVAAVGPAVSVIGTVVSGIGSVISVAGTLMSALGALLTPVGLVVAAIAAVVAIGVTLYKHWDELTAWTSEKWSAIKDTVSGAVKSAKDKVSAAWDGIKTKTAEAWANVKSAVSDKVNSIVSSTSDKFNSVKNTVTNIWESIKSAIRDKIDSAKEAVRSAIEKIKGFFNFDWSLPKIKLPHFSMTGSFSLMPPSIPKISVSWYKKAMDNAMVLDNAAIFGAAGGKLLGGGEAGREVVSGESHLLELINASVDSAIGQRMDGLVALLQRYLPACAQQKVAVPVSSMSRELAKDALRGAAAW